MKVAKQAVKYYCDVTGKEWSEFYSRLDEALTSENPTGEVWLVKMLINEVVKSGMSIQEFKINKDAVKGVFDEEARKNAGEFFTPEIWCAEGRKYFDKHIPNWKDYTVWDMSCYTMDTELFTKRGWVTYDELLDSDEIYTLNKVSGLAEWSGFYNRFKKLYTGKIVDISTRKLSLSVTSDHKVYFKTPDTNYSFMTAGQISSKPSYNRILPIAAKLDEVDTNIKVLRFSSECDLRNFWYFIGLYLGDGYLIGNNKVATFGFKKERKIEQLTKVLSDLGIAYTVTHTTNERTMIYVQDTNVNDFIRDYVGTGGMEKKVPFEFVSLLYYTSILNGLIDSDGTRGASTEFYTESPSLCGDFEYLATLSGFASSTKQRSYFDKRTGNTSKGFRVCLYTATETSFKPSSVTERDYNDFVWDLTTVNDNHIFLVRQNGHQCFSSNCGSGNLLRTANLPDPSKVYLSTLQKDDITLIRNTPEYLGANAFQLDFLNILDYDRNNAYFLNSLPQGLIDVILNDKPLIIYANPPYKTGCARVTDVGSYMSGIGLSKPACDIYYQFVWRVMHMVEMFNLKNTYFCHFGPLAFFTGSSNVQLLKDYEHCFEFVDGMCLAAQEFSDTSSSVAWGIGCSLWKARGGYLEEHIHKDILLEKKFKLPDGTIGSEGRVLYAPPRMKLSKWVQPTDADFLDQAPLMSSHLTFKGSDINVKVAPQGAKLATNALGTMMTNNTFTRSEQQSAILSMPSTIQHCDITEENFWRCVASYTFRRLFDASWAVAKKEISAPDTTVAGYNEWVINALVIFLFDWNSMMSSIRDVEYGGMLVNVRNKLFYCTEDEIRANCTDEKILADLDKNPMQNGYMISQILKVKDYWHEDVKALFDFCRDYTLATLDLRATVGYEGSLDCWDAGFQQIRSNLWSTDMEDKLKCVLAKAKDVLRKDISNFGFISEVEGE